MNGFLCCLSNLNLRLENSSSSIRSSYLSWCSRERSVSSFFCRRRKCYTLLEMIAGEQRQFDPVIGRGNQKVGVGKFRLLCRCAKFSTIRQRGIDSQRKSGTRTGHRIDHGDQIVRMDCFQHIRLLRRCWKCSTTLQTVDNLTTTRATHRRIV